MQPIQRGMDVGSATGAEPLLVAAMQSQVAATAAQAGMLRDVLDMALQMNAQLLEGMRAASAVAGTGASVDTWA